MFLFGSEVLIRIEEKKDLKLDRVLQLEFTFIFLL